MEIGKAHRNSTKLFLKFKKTGENSGFKPRTKKKQLL